MALVMAANVANVYDVGAFDAKTYFSELLRKAQNGAVINISKNGKQVAVLQGVNNVKAVAAFDAHKRILERSKRLADYRKKYGLDAINVHELKELKNEGRKY